MMIYVTSVGNLDVLVALAAFDFGIDRRAHSYNPEEKKSARCTKSLVEGTCILHVSVVHSKNKKMRKSTYFFSL